MPSVRLNSVSFSYTSAVDVIRQASLDIGSGWTGVIGPNGSGKSTLLHLISGELRPDSGNVTVSSDMPAVICRQEVGDVDESILSLATADQGFSRRIMGGLGLEAFELGRWHSLSPGERKRWQIGAALALEPDILLLDEPTNHLDIHARSLLRDALRRFRGVGLVVSHDRTFLNELTTKTIRVEHGVVEMGNGNYEVARASWDSDARREQAVYDDLKREQKKQTRRLADERRNAETKTAGHKRRLRNAGPTDSDARSVAAKNRHQSGEAKGSRRLETMRAEIDRTTAELESFEMRRQFGKPFFFEFEPPRRDRLLNYKGPLQAGDRLIADDVSAEMRRDDRIWLRGDNGAGKSTLLSALVGNSSLPRHRVLYLQQEITETESTRVLDSLFEATSGERGRTLNIVAALGVEPDRLLKSKRPSPGEARKLTMALGMAQGAWCLVLDEPTNHLDLPSIERLEDAIAAYPGSVLLVTHDEEFAGNTTTANWHLSKGQLAFDA